MAITQLKDRIARLLRERDIAGVDNIEIAVNGRNVELSGVIDDLECKRRCLDCCRHVVGVAQVVDNLQLKDDQVHTGSLRAGASAKRNPPC